MDDAPESPAPAPRRGGAPVLALVAIGLSLSALLVSVFEVAAIRDEQRIQVWPYVAVTTRYNAEGLALVASNKGIGPARIRRFDFSVDGRAIENAEALDAAIADAVGPENAFSYDTYSVSNPARSVMSPDESVNLFSVPWNERTRLLAERWNGRVEIDLCYCSVYDECWLARLNEGEPEPVASCAAASATGP